MLGTHARSGSVGATEHHGHRDLTGGHVQGLGGGVDDMVDGLQKNTQQQKYTTVSGAAQDCTAILAPC